MHAGSQGHFSHASRYLIPGLVEYLHFINRIIDVKIIAPQSISREIEYSIIIRIKPESLTNPMKKSRGDKA